LRRAVGLPEAEGLLVRQVEADGPAAAAGVKEGDLIVEAARRPVTTADELREALDSLDPGAPLELKVLRGVEELTMSVRAGGGDA
jgi:serine protease Do